MRTYRKCVCGICPKYKAWTKDSGNCLIRGGLMLRVHPACEWGRKLIRKLYVHNYNKNYYETNIKGTAVAQDPERDDSVRGRCADNDSRPVRVRVGDVDGNRNGRAR